MATAQAILTRSLRLLGVIESGNSPTAEELSDGLESLNAIIETWQTDDRAYFSQVDSTFTLTTGTGQYAIGDTVLTVSSITRASTTATATTETRHSLETGNRVTIAGCVQTDYNITAAVTVTGAYTFTYTVANSPATPATTLTSITAANANFNTARPVDLLGAFVRASNVDYQLGIITERRWDTTPNKTTQAPQPTKILYRPGYPFGQLLLLPVPSAAGTLHIKTRNCLQPYSAVTDDQPMPPGYFRALCLATAIDIAPEYGAKVTPEVLASVTNAFQALWGLNTSKPPSSKDNQRAAPMLPAVQVQQP